MSVNQLLPIHEYYVLEKRFSKELDKHQDGNGDWDKMTMIACKYNKGFFNFGPGPNYEERMNFYLSRMSICRHLSPEDMYKIAKQWYDYESVSYESRRDREVLKKTKKTKKVSMDK
jgi:hypothetical protein